MCGRTACTLDPEEVSRASRYRTRGGQNRRPRWRDGDADKYRPSYNKSPQSCSPVLLSHRHFDKDAPVDQCVLAAMRWGLVPAWFQDSEPRTMKFSTINCRSESLLQKKTFKDPFLKGQRCVVLADGFYEWRRQGKEKQPYFIYFPQTQTGPGEAGRDPGDGESQEEEGEQEQWSGWRLLTIAGLFERWTPPGSEEPVYTYTVITVDAAPNLHSIHDRMPAVLDGEADVRRWLDFGEVKSLDALKLLQPTNLLTFHPVSSLVNNSRNNSPECLQPVDLQAKKEPTASSKMMRSWLNNSSTSKRSQEPGAEQGPATAQEPGAKADRGAATAQEPGSKADRGPSTAQEPGAKANRGPSTAQEPGAKANRGPADSGPLHRWLQGSSKKPRLSVGTEELPGAS